MERLSYYSIQTSLVERLTGLGVGAADAATAATTWSAACYAFAIAGAYLADAVIGRYAVIVGGMVVYMAGLGAVVGVTAASRGASSLLASLYVVALGTGSIKASVAPFGAALFRVEEAEGGGGEGDTPPTAWPNRERALLARYWNAFYASINVGALVASLAVVNVQRSSWTLGYAIPLAAFALALIAFLAGTPLYEPQPPVRGPLQAFARVLRGAWRQRRRPQDAPPLLAPGAPAARSAFMPWLDKAALPAGQEAASAPAAGATRKPPSLPPVSAADVEDAKRVLAYLLICLPATIFWMAYAQMGAAFIVQALPLDRRVGRFEIAAATLNAFNTAAIIVLLPLYDIAVDWLRKRGRVPTTLQRIGAGLAAAALAMAAAAVAAAATRPAIAAGAPPSVFWLAPQFALVGAAEVLASVGLLELAFADAPRGARSLLQAAALASVAVGSALASAYSSVPAVAAWIPDKERGGRLDLYYAALTALTTANVALFVVIARWYKPRALVERATGVVAECALVERA